MFRKILRAKWFLGLFGLLGLLAGALSLYWNSSSTQAQTGEEGRFPAAVYTEDLALVVFQRRSVEPPGRTLFRQPCPPAEIQLLDGKGRPVKAQHFAGCHVDVQGMEHYTFMLWGAFTTAQDLWVHVRFPAVEGRLEYATRLRAISDAAQTGAWKGKAQLQGMLVTPAGVLVRWCQDLPDAGDWVPQEGGLRWPDGTQWMLEQWGIPDFRQPGVLQSKHRCFLLFFAPAKMGPAPASAPQAIQVTWKRNWPECMDAKTFAQTLRPALEAEGLQPNQVFTQMPDGVWCFRSGSPQAGKALDIVTQALGGSFTVEVRR